MHEHRYTEWVSGKLDMITCACECGDRITFALLAKDRISVDREYTWVKSGARVRVTGIDWNEGDELVRFKRLSSGNYGVEKMAVFRHRVGLSKK